MSAAPKTGSAPTELSKVYEGEAVVAIEYEVVQLKIPMGRCR